MIVKYEDILNIYEKEIAKNVKNKRALYFFELNKTQNLCDIMEMLLNNEVGHTKYNIFKIYEPKLRLIMSLNVKDKVINHYVARYILEEKLTKYLDCRNVATRECMGTDRAIKLVKKYICELKKDKFYILKIDISKYFYTINHNILKNMLKDKLSEEEYIIVSKIIDSTSNEDILNTIKNIKGYDGPYYEIGKGLPIGNMTSQFLSIYYLNEIDHFIIHNLKLKRYVRYMDDFIIFDRDHNKLKKALDIIKDKLTNEYDLNVNEKKSFIINSSNAFSFLGYTFKIMNNKMIVNIKKENIYKIKKKLKKKKCLYNKGLISNESMFASVSNYHNSFKYGSDKCKMWDIINKIIYEE